MKHLYFNGTMNTMSDAKTAKAVLCENGKIIAIGTKKCLESYARNAQVINLHGAAMFPAFIDSHSHAAQMASKNMQVQLDDAKTLDEVRCKIAGFIAKNNVAGDELVVAAQYDNAYLPELTTLSREYLDEISRDRPLVIQHRSGHSAVFNSAALKIIGEAERENIYAEENELIEFLRRLPPQDPVAFSRAYRQAQLEYASHGISTVQEGYFVQEMIPMYKDLIRCNNILLPTTAYAEKSAYDKALAEFSEVEKFRIGGVKTFLDGSPQMRTAFMREPYIDSQSRSNSVISREDLLDTMNFAAERNTQLLAHCNGDAAADMFLECLEECERHYPNMRLLRPVIIHAQFIAPDAIARAANLGVVLSFFVAHVYHFGDIHIKNFGMERAKRMSSMKTALQNGAVFTVHQDAPVVAPDMLETIWCAVNRVTKSGLELGTDERIGVYDALCAVTRNAAYQYFEENEKGSIEIGKNENFVILDRDILSINPYEIRDVNVLATIVQGKMLYGKI